MRANKIERLHFGFVLTPSADGRLLAIPKGALGVDKEGCLAFVGSRADLEPDDKEAIIQDHGSGILFPGFVDLHVHLPQIGSRGRSRSDLLQWLHKDIYPAEAKFADPEYAGQCARRFVKECARNGVTTTVAFLTSHKEASKRSISVIAESGIRSVVGAVQMDRNGPQELLNNVEDSISCAEELAGKWHGYDSGRVKYALIPRFAISCSDRLLKELGRLKTQAPSLYVHTHLSEQKGEIDEVSRLFPQADDYLSVYEDAGLVGELTLFAHCIHLSDRELSSLISQGAGVAHCPSSNLFLKSGIFPWQRSVDADLRFGLGSDVGAGPEMSPFRVMRDAYFMQLNQVIPPDELLWRATLGAAQALGMEDEIGSLEVGKEADFVVLDLKGRPEMEDQDHSSIEGICSSLVFLGDDRVVRESWVRGKRLER